MIFRKPYAFLIKHFKLIHLILCVISIYVITSFAGIYNFFNEFVKNNYSHNVKGELSQLFISGYTYTFFLVLVIILILLVFLMGTNKKKQKFYSISLIVYIILYCILAFYNTVLNDMEMNIISAESSRIYRDIILIAYLFQFIFISFFAIRTLGFNIKQFNFSYDLKELNIDHDDNEIEININFNMEKVKKGGRKYFREFKYYLRENIAIIIILILAVSGFLTYNIITNSQNFNNSNYNELETFTYNNLNITINESFITANDTSGSLIKQDTTFLVAIVTIENMQNQNISLDTNQLKLVSDSNEYTPSLVYSENFVDFGGYLSNGYISKNSKNTFVIPYIINEEEADNQFEIKIYNGFTITNNDATSTYNVIKLEPIQLFDAVNVSTNSLGEDINFSNTYLGNTKFNIKEYQINNSYYYDDEYCISDKCTTYKKAVTIDVTKDNDKTIMILNGEIELDDSTSYYKINPYETSLVDNFMFVEYIYEDETYYEKVNSLDPNLEDTLLIKVSNDIKKASSINIIITLRNKEYKYIIK